MNTALKTKGEVSLQIIYLQGDIVHFHLPSFIINIKFCEGEAWREIPPDVLSRCIQKELLDVIYTCSYE